MISAPAWAEWSTSYATKLGLPDISFHRFVLKPKYFPAGGGTGRDAAASPPGSGASGEYRGAGHLGCSRPPQPAAPAGNARTSAAAKAAAVTARRTVARAA